MSLTLVIGSMVGLFDRNTCGAELRHTAIKKKCLLILFIFFLKQPATKLTQVHLPVCRIFVFSHTAVSICTHNKCGAQTWG